MPCIRRGDLACQRELSLGVVIIMANVKISGLPLAGALLGSELVPVVQNGVTKRATIAQVNAGGTTPANGQIDIGNGTGFTRSTLTAGSNISITNGAGSITISAATPPATPDYLIQGFGII